MPSPAQRRRGGETTAKIPGHLRAIGIRGGMTRSKRCAAAKNKPLWKPMRSIAPGVQASDPVHFATLQELLEAIEG